jgi:hypothetical protein
MSCCVASFAILVLPRAASVKAERPSRGTLSEVAQPMRSPATSGLEGFP